MMKCSALFIFLLLFFADIDINAQITFRDDNQDGMLDVLLFDGSTQGASVIVEQSIASSSQVLDAYLPVNDGAGNVDFSTLDNAASVIFVQADTHARVKIDYENKSDKNHYINVAVKLNTSSDWLALTPLENNSARIVNSLSRREMTLTVSLDDLENISGITYQTTRETIYEMYIFFHELIQDTNTIDPRSYTGGVYFDLHFSQALPGNTLNLIDLLKGDRRLTVIFSGAQGISNNSLRHRILAFDVATVPVGSNIQAVYGFMNRGRAGSILAVENIGNEGSFSIQSLENNITYNIGLSVEDKFQFSSALSNYLSEAPEEISAFLDDQACYIFSAGFHKHHYIVRFLRDFRDRYLLLSKPGRIFVSWYYRTAPRYAAMVYHSYILKGLIRGLGYLLYFFINFFKIIGVILCSLLAIGIYRRYSH